MDILILVIIVLSILFKVLMKIHMQIHSPQPKGCKLIIENQSPRTACFLTCPVMPRPDPHIM